MQGEVAGTLVVCAVLLSLVSILGRATSPVLRTRAVCRLSWREVGGFRRRQLLSEDRQNSLSRGLMRPSNGFLYDVELK